jgi:hypothetical protein
MISDRRLEKFINGRALYSSILRFFMIIHWQSIHAKGYMVMDMSNDLRMDFEDHNSKAGQQTVESVQPRQSEVSTVAVTDIKEHDILLGRGKSNANHIGNVLFQGKALMIDYRIVCAAL